jgi:hypothetical protein
MSKMMASFALGMLFLVVCVQCQGDSKGQLSNGEIDTRLATLEPLPKVHYFWPPPTEASNRRLYELTRITHSLSVSGDWSIAGYIDNRVYICAKVNKTRPNIKALLGVNFIPWHRKFGKNLPPTDRGPTYREELRYFEERALFVKQQVEQSNNKYKSDIKVGAVTLDTERFHVRKGDNRWNESIREALDAIHTRAQSIFPHARIEWFGRGMIQAAVDSGWSKTRYWTGREIKAPLSCSLYAISEIECMRETYRRTCKLADELGIEDVTPWVALGAGYKRDIEKFQRWSFDWDYDLVYSWLLGAELNIKWYGDRPERFAPYNRAKVIIFYPPPFDTRTPNWPKHFIAYVRGATGVKELGDLGYEE